MSDVIKRRQWELEKGRNTIWAKHKGYRYNFVQLDAEEHPKIKQDDYLPLMEKILDCVDDYFGVDGYYIEKHSASWWVVKDDKQYARVIWDNDNFYSSQIATKEGAEKVAQYIADILNGDIELEMYRRTITDGMYEIRDSEGVICSFESKHRRDKYYKKLTEHHLPIVDDCNSKIIKSVHGDTTVRVHSLIDDISPLKAKAICQMVCNYIKEDIVEVC